MAGYTPLKVTGNETGLVQSREEFLLPNDAYPVLENAFVWRERIKRKQGFQLLGRLQRIGTGAGVTGAGQTSIGINSFAVLGITEPLASLAPGTLSVTVGAPDASTFVDNGDGTFTVTGKGNAATSSINYKTGMIVLGFNVPLTGGGAITFSVGYFPGLPVMGLRTRELSGTNNEQTIAFDTKYSYEFDSGINQWKEFPSGIKMTWNGTDSDFFWSTNFWTDPADATKKLFWVTNFNFDGVVKDPIRYTNGIDWFNFGPTGAPTTGQIDATNFLNQALCLLPFRGRLLAFNTVEGPNLAGSIQYSNRIRWAQIGNPLVTYTNPAPPTQPTGSWRDDIRGKGGFLDIPTNEAIVSVGFVRDNLVIYCERSTWQLRYTGRSIAPFQIEKVNSELGAESTFSAVQFDTSLVGVGDKGIVECDSFKSNRIDIKIPDLVFEFNNNNDGTKRVHGIRDFVQRLAYWIYPFKDNNGIYPDHRLVYNYENDSWAIFTDSLTCLGTFQPQQSRKWNDVPSIKWQKANFSWLNRPALIPAIIGGNQQGYVEYIGGSVESGQTSNDESLYIFNITGFGITPSDNPVSINSPNHNLQTGQIIQIIGIPIGTPFYTELNDGIFQANVTDADNFYLTVYDSDTQQYNEPALAPVGVYVGGAQIRVRDNFSITSKKFNYLDQGKQFQLGYIDILMDDTDNGAITLNVYNDYNNSDPSNQFPQNASNDKFFNSTVPTNAAGIGVKGGDKNWQRVFCATNSNFVTIEWTLSNEQMQNQCQESDVQIDAQVIWSRVGGRQGITQ